MNDIEYSWQSTPQRWMATRPGLCWCEECRGKHAKGFGKTREEALVDLLEREDDAADLVAH